MDKNKTEYLFRLQDLETREGVEELLKGICETSREKGVSEEDIQIRMKRFWEMWNEDFEEGKE